MQNLKENWLKVLDLLEKEVTAVSFDLWIKTLEPVEINNDCLIIKASSETAKQRVLNMHSGQIKLVLSEVFDNINCFEILNDEEFDEYKKQQVDVKCSTEEVPTRVGQKLNPKYTFDSFVVGKSNQYAYAVSRNVAENPSGKFNPLFIYGGVGLGKTHLMHAIGNYLQSKNSKLKVVYVTCEKFTNDYIDSLRNNNKDKSITSFREKYRNVDVLIVDDIQFITNKMETQEEFFNTFNDLYQNDKQIIISSDRPPKEIATLSDRLKSRFASGVMQDVQLPDFETRVAILKKKAQEENYNIEDEVINELAERIDTNIRELEGSLSKVCFYANLLGKKFATMEDLNEALKDEQKDKSQLNPKVIIDTVCKYYNISKTDLVGKKKNKEIVDPRQMCMYLITELLDLPLASIGTLFGGRDHTTIIHARDKISNAIKTNQKLKIEANDLKNLILKK